MPLRAFADISLGAADGGRFSTFFFFTTGMAAGIAAGLLAIPGEAIGRRFFILMTFLAIAFYSLGLAAAGLSIDYFHVACAGLLIAYNVILPAQRGVDVSARRGTREAGRAAAGYPRSGSGPRPWLPATARAFLVAAAACGGTAVVRDALALPPPPGLADRWGPWVLAATFVTSALVLGSALAAMVLGHWYLVIRKPTFVPLTRATLFLGAALVARFLVVALAAFAQVSEWQSRLSLAGPTAFFLWPGLFVLVRVLFGLATPCVLAWMTWRCVRIRSNQSATGILYVNLAFVLLGEIISKYFLVAEGLVL